METDIKEDLKNINGSLASWSKAMVVPENKIETIKYLFEHQSFGANFKELSVKLREYIDQVESFRKID